MKISSEAAGYVSLTPVEAREVAFPDLIERILALTGKNSDRIGEILERGSLISGPARYRWEPLTVDAAELASVLAGFPDPEPERPFDKSKCGMVVLRSRRGSLEISREAACQRRFLKRQSFWDKMLPLLEDISPSYDRYSYSDRADVYVARLPLATLRKLLEHAPLLKYTTLLQQLWHLEAESAELFVER